MRWRKKERIGSMNERIVIQTVSEAQSTSGFPAPTWSTFATVWANVQFGTSGADERILADRETSISPVLFTVRYRTDVTEKMRVSWRSDLFDIEAIMPAPEKDYMILKTKRRE